ncbi:hypothetical protein CIK52_01645 [Kocuria rosea]|uniref:DNA primase family protein n=1 Tax=Kocuria rosea TaxID=1275 RepID=UPI000D650F0E|nr:phage/plasmid primase, P4 family [Kocuria rosea]PWF88028.1 hypothetical protein CIK52_01645 [Kocuria rosea]QCY32628.1 hypothetical protein EQG70_06815 [Kocuria rosea]TQN34681.1 putative DNA primase/helicase [Kocuria rosea]
MSTTDDLDAFLRDQAEGFAPRDVDKETSGQTRLAHRLAARHTGRLLHVHGLGWLRWDGKRWAEDRGDKHAKRAVEDTLRRAWREAQADDSLAKDVRVCQSDNARAGILKIAASLEELTAEVEDLDAAPHLLNTPAGTLDLWAMDLRPHDPVDRITRSTAGAWRPGQFHAGTWQTFLETSLPDPEVRAFLARYVGQALFGAVREQKLVILTGEGSNGKSVFADALRHALGEAKTGGYAATAPPDMLLVRKDTSAFDGSVELRGARWAVLSETEKGRELNVAMVKRLTGGDPITARNLYKPLITFEPSHTLAMVANDPPHIPDTGHAIWRRVLVVPWNVKFADTPEKVAEGLPPADLDLPAKLAADADAVLAWAVEGWTDYQARDGLAAPDAVQIATAAYREDNDDVAQFLNDCTQPAGGQVVGVKAMHDRYVLWARAMSKERHLGRKEFSKELDAHKSSHQFRRNARGECLGLMLRPDWNCGDVD